MVEDGSNGFLVPVKKPLALADRIERLIRDDALRLQMGKRSRRIFLDRFTEDKWQQNMNEVLEKV
jgi:glycosyltransferase involved in cell wall biosynthesis